MLDVLFSLFLCKNLQIIKKLGGKVAGTASWATNVGNEYGQVLMSVLTESEGDGLGTMATGLVQRYKESQVPPPKVLYVDRDCCSSKLKSHFKEWGNMVIRLDAWHFMRRFAAACTSESRALYPTFMSRLSACVFEWDAEDLQRLYAAKKSQLHASGVWSLQETNVALHITKKELASHCKCRTRGHQETTRLIKELIDTFSSDKGKDTMGIPLLDSSAVQRIWQEQQRHIPCIQDIPDIQLYTKTGTIKKGGVELPVYRCARGSTSLESFHLHIDRFIPGKWRSLSRNYGP